MSCTELRSVAQFCTELSRASLPNSIVTVLYQDDDTRTTAIVVLQLVAYSTVLQCTVL